MRNPPNPPEPSPQFSAPPPPPALIRHPTRRRRPHCRLTLPAQPRLRHHLRSLLLLHPNPPPPNPRWRWFLSPNRSSFACRGHVSRALRDGSLHSFSEKESVLQCQRSGLTQDQSRNGRIAQTPPPRRHVLYLDSDITRRTTSSPALPHL
jgi:hypothetical protein